jgi:hypothetical protein
MKTVMLVEQLVWSIWGDEDEDISDHLVQSPSWETIQERFTLLDGQTHPSLSLYIYSQLQSPVLSVYGGPDEYTAVLEREPSYGRGTFERLQLINSARFRRLEIDRTRTVGKGYFSYNIEEHFFTPDTGLILSLAQHFAFHGQWHPRVPFIVEADDEEGEWRRYTD